MCLSSRCFPAPDSGSGSSAAPPPPPLPAPPAAAAPPPPPPLTEMMGSSDREAAAAPLPPCRAAARSWRRRRRSRTGTSASAPTASRNSTFLALYMSPTDCIVARLCPACTHTQQQQQQRRQAKSGVYCRPRPRSPAATAMMGLAAELTSQHALQGRASCCSTGFPSPAFSLPAHLDRYKVDGKVPRQQRDDESGEGDPHNRAHKIDHPAAARASRGSSSSRGSNGRVRRGRCL
jgi:hypothetical protein